MILCFSSEEQVINHGLLPPWWPSGDWGPVGIHRSEYGAFILTNSQICSVLLAHDFLSHQRFLVLDCCSVPNKAMHIFPGASGAPRPGRDGDGVWCKRGSDQTQTFPFLVNLPLWPVDADWGQLFCTNRWPTRPSPGRRRGRGAWWAWTSCPGASSWTSSSSAPGTTARERPWWSTHSPAASACCWTMRPGPWPTTGTARPASTPSTVSSPRSCSRPAGSEKESASPSAPCELWLRGGGWVGATCGPPASPWLWMVPNRGVKSLRAELSLKSDLPSSGQRFLMPWGEKSSSVLTSSWILKSAFFKKRKQMNWNHARWSVFVYSTSSLLFVSFGSLSK